MNTGLYILQSYTLSHRDRWNQYMSVQGSFRNLLHILVFRHVILPSDIAKLVQKGHLMTESEWRNIGVQQSPGWIHYAIHSPGLDTTPHIFCRNSVNIHSWFFVFCIEPHILLFRRRLPPKNCWRTSLWEWFDKRMPVTAFQLIMLLELFSTGMLVSSITGVTCLGTYF